MRAARPLATLSVFLLAGPPIGLLIAGALATLLLPTITMHGGVTPFRLALLNLPLAYGYGSIQALAIAVVAIATELRGGRTWLWTLVAAAIAAAGFLFWARLLDPSALAIFVAHVTAAVACLGICGMLGSPGSR